MKLRNKFIFLLMICGSTSLCPMEKVDNMLGWVLRRVSPQSFLDKLLLYAILNPATKHVVECVLYAGASVNACDSLGWTVLMHALEQRELDKVKLLLEKGAYLNSVSFFGKTALNSAHSVETVQLLLNQMSRILNAAAYFEADEVINEEVKERIKNIDFTGIDTIGMLYEVLNQQMVDAVDKMYLKHPGSIEILHVLHQFLLCHGDKFPLLRAEINYLIILRNGEDEFKKHMEYIRHSNWP